MNEPNIKYSHDVVIQDQRIRQATKRLYELADKLQTDPFQVVHGVLTAYDGHRVSDAGATARNTRDIVSQGRFCVLF